MQGDVGHIKAVMDVDWTRLWRTVLFMYTNKQSDMQQTEQLPRRRMMFVPEQGVIDNLEGLIFAESNTCLTPVTPSDA